MRACEPHHRELHLTVNLLHSGVSPSVWWLPGARADAFVDIDHYVRVARIAEKAKLDAIFLADTPAINDRIDHRPFNALEPTVVLASVAAATTHVGPQQFRMRLDVAYEPRQERRNLLGAGAFRCPRTAIRRPKPMTRPTFKSPWRRMAADAVSQSDYR